MSIATLPAGSLVITETYSGDGNFSPGSGTVSEDILVSVYVLNAANPSPTLTGTLYLSSGAELEIPGRVIVDSPSRPAVTVSGTAKIVSSYNGVVGTVSETGNAVTPTPVTGIKAVADPLAGLAVPSLTGTASSVSYSSGTYTISPGIYSKITLSGTASLTLNPGVYVIAGGGLSVTGSASVDGSGVMIYNANSNYPKSGGTSGSITLNSTGKVDLSAPTTGVYAGFLFFQSSTDSSSLSIGGGSSTSLTGAIYAEAALLSDRRQRSARRLPRRQPPPDQRDRRRCRHPRIEPPGRDRSASRPPACPARRSSRGVRSSRRPSRSRSRPSRPDHRLRAHQQASAGSGPVPATGYRSWPVRRRPPRRAAPPTWPASPARPCPRRMRSHRRPTSNLRPRPRRIRTWTSRPSRID